MPQQQTYQWDVPFGVLTSVHPVHLVFPFIFNQIGCSAVQRCPINRLLTGIV